MTTLDQNDKGRLPTERQRARRERNDTICRLYLEGKSLADIGRQFGLKRQRIKQIVVEAGLWRKRMPAQNERDEFLGINISESDKVALRAEAARLGVSMSAMTAEWIKDRLEALREHHQ